MRNGGPTKECDSPPERDDFQDRIHLIRKEIGSGMQEEMVIMIACC